ncbi:hypothetical protein [uncultured Mucilaginibacter sp.]|uniref:hypothetical protein n=1 Tax=uncultured Mucilaginibacter sp. TaxID=797541 RepID=UPI0025CF299F|nr:hypothetical protein [uncultured Mucilaginibacter sp.]
MKKKITKILLYTFGIFLFLFVVLAVHIYFVYRPAPDAFTRVMARIDVKQRITQDDANKISSFMVHQKGVDHVLVNPQTSIVVFTFFPVKTTGDQVVNNFKAHFPYKADRFMPTAENLKHSCPVAASSYTYKIYKVITKVI